VAGALNHSTGRTIEIGGSSREIDMSFSKALVLTFLMPITGSVVAQAIDEALDAQTAKSLEVDNTVGSVEITGWDRDEVAVTGTLGEAERIDFEQRGDRIVIDVIYPRRSGNLRGAELEISAPRRHALIVEVVSADAEIRGIEGAQELSAVSGDFSTEQFAATIEIRSVSGDMLVTGNKAADSTRAASVSGDINLSGTRGEVSARSVSGDVRVEVGSLDRGAFETTSGDVEVRASLLTDAGRLEISSVSGDVELLFDGNASASYRLTTVSGSIDNCFGPSSERASRYGPGERLLFTEGGVNARVTVSTTSGDIEICRN